ncbi:MAG: hypothetical protein RQ738_09185 [Sulfuriflexus sp.]|nr:hypothetical protein [Sulfuriflexus sp.]
MQTMLASTTLAKASIIGVSMPAVPSSAVLTATTLEPAIKGALYIVQYFRGNEVGLSRVD